MRVAKVKNLKKERVYGLFCFPSIYTTIIWIRFRKVVEIEPLDLVDGCVIKRNTVHASNL